MERPVSNTLLTKTEITRKALKILHSKLNFIGSINRQYDDRFAQSGAKIGDSLQIRLPNKYTVTDGATMVAQDTTESSVTLQVQSQKHVSMNFGSAELALKMDDFADRILEPAMAVLAAKVEADALSMYKDVYQQAGTINSPLTLNMVATGRKKLVDALTPTGNLTALLNTQNQVDMVDGLKGLLNPTPDISKQYRDGIMGRAVGFDFMESSLLTPHTSGTDASAYLVNQTGASGATVTVNTGTGTFKKGDIVTLAGCNRCHPESKADTGELMQFTITSDVSANATSLPISPSIVLTGALQNVFAAPTNTGAVTKVGGNAEAYGISLLYHRDAFTFATADLPLYKGADMCERATYDGISLRLWRDGDILNDKCPTRIDVLYGFKTIRAEMACRLGTN
jgi:hypothetical protein